jgi:hypothetical protein
MQKNKILAISLSLLFLSACAGLTRKNRTEVEASGAPNEVYTDGANEGSAPPVLLGKQRKVAVVLGPGAAKTFAYPAILKALVQKRIPIHQVVGVEWGALSAGFFALSGKPHEAEWKLYKFDPKIIEGGGLFKSDKTTKVNALDSFLKENLTAASVDSLSVPFSCPSFSLRRGTVSFKTQNQLWLAVRNCLSSVPRVSPVNETVPAMMSLREIAESLRKDGFDTIILVNALGGNHLFGPKDNDLSWSEKLFWLEVRRSVWAAKSHYTDVIELDAKGFSLFDFAAKKEMSMLGQSIGETMGSQLVTKYGF